MRIGLVGCVKEKATAATAAADLYTSQLFRGRRRYVEQSCDRWYILSAKYGLLRPTDMVEPYDQTLDGAPRALRRAWASRVLNQLTTEVDDVRDCTFEVHAGMSYRDYGLVAGLRDLGATVEVPAEGLNQGRQRAFYANASASADRQEQRARAHSVASNPPLTAWLRQATSPVTLSFAEIEAILGRPLPASARRHRAWWSNSETQTVPRQWLAAGWRADMVDMVAGRIRLAK